MKKETLTTIYAVRKKLEEVSVRGIESINALKACMDTLTKLIAEESADEDQDKQE
nr:MAG TPA: hypothetical protein [Caudoviricetes sp.]